MATSDSAEIIGQLQAISEQLEGSPGRATVDDVYNRLGSVISLLERNNQMLYLIGQNAVENEEFWHRQNGNA